MNKRKIFIGTLEVAGVATNLSIGLKELGHEVTLITKFPHPYKYEDPGTRNRFNTTWQKLSVARLKLNGLSSGFKPFGFILDKIFGMIVLIYIIMRCNIVVLNFGSCICARRLDLILLKLFRKQIIVLYLGSDSRPPYLDGGRYPGIECENLPTPRELIKQVRACKKMVALHERYADHIINNRYSGKFFSKKFIDYETFGPVSIRQSHNEISDKKKTKVNGLNKSIRIVHAPSNPFVKGTYIIEKIIDQLNQEGYDISLIRLQGLPSSEVQAQLENCDFVIDQLYSDYISPVFATEAAFKGKAVIIAGYAASRDFSENIEKSTRTLFVHPEQIREAILYLVEKPEFRSKLAECALEFARANNTPLAVAEKFEFLFSNRVPDEWYYSPKTSDMMIGCGLPEVRRNCLISLLEETYGASAL